MYQKILIPTDGSDLCWKAAQEGIRFAKANDAKVVAFHAIPTTSYMLFPESGPSDSIIDRFEKEADQRANLFVAKIIDHAQTAGIRAEAVCHKTDYVWKGIIETATAHSCDLIFMAYHGRRGLANLLLGSETMKVLTHSSIAVLVYR